MGCITAEKKKQCSFLEVGAILHHDTRLGEKSLACFQSLFTPFAECPGWESHARCTTTSMGLSRNLQSLGTLAYSQDSEASDLAQTDGVRGLRPEVWEGLYFKGSTVQFISVTQSSLTLCNPMDLQHARLPCPSPAPGACSNSCPLSQ